MCEISLDSCARAWVESPCSTGWTPFYRRDDRERRVGWIHHASTMCLEGNPAKSTPIERARSPTGRFLLTRTRYPIVFTLDYRLCNCVVRARGLLWCRYAARAPIPFLPMDQMFLRAASSYSLRVFWSPCFIGSNLKDAIGKSCYINYNLIFMD